VASIIHQQSVPKMKNNHTMKPRATAMIIVGEMRAHRQRTGDEVL
jgi:hypothetical protein